MLKVFSLTTKLNPQYQAVKDKILKKLDRTYGIGLLSLVKLTDNKHDMFIKFHQQVKKFDDILKIARKSEK